MLTLSIGIGATAAVATVANPMFFRPLPVPDPDELVAITQLDEHTSVFPHPLSYPEYLDYRERNDVFEGLAAHAVAEALLSIEGRAAERIQIEYVSDNYFAAARQPDRVEASRPPRAPRTGRPRTPAPRRAS